MNVITKYRYTVKHIQNTTMKASEQKKKIRDQPKEFESSNFNVDLKHLNTDNCMYLRQSTTNYTENNERERESERGNSKIAR